MCHAVLPLCQTHALAQYLKMYTFLALTIKTKVNDQSISQLEHNKKVALVPSELEDGCQKRVEIKGIPSYIHTQATTA